MRTRLHTHTHTRTHTYVQTRIRLDPLRPRSTKRHGHTKRRPAQRLDQADSGTSGEVNPLATFKTSPLHRPCGECWEGGRRWLSNANHAVPVAQRARHQLSPSARLRAPLLSVPPQLPGEEAGVWGQSSQPGLLDSLGALQSRLGVDIPTLHHIRLRQS